MPDLRTAEVSFWLNHICKYTDFEKRGGPDILLFQLFPFHLRSQLKKKFPLFCVLSVTAIGAPKLSMTALSRNIVTREGVAGLYRGISPNLLKVIPAVTVSFVAYEYTRIFLGVDVEGRKSGK